MGRGLVGNSLISEISDDSGLIQTDHVKINNTFKLYYSNLYASQSTSDPSDMNSFMANLNTPTISQDQRATLESPFSERDILQAISSLQSGKTLGPDLFPCEFYKVLSFNLSPLLCAVFSEIHTNVFLPQTFTQATISVTLKKNKDPRRCESYRPISLLNVDYNILTKALALCLEKIMPTIIYPDRLHFK